MAFPSPGDRVGVLAGIEGGIARFIGWGRYDGLFVPPPEAVGWGQVLRQKKTPHPRITLDDGRTVWGWECWFGTEKVIGDRLNEVERVEMVDIDDVRSQRRRVQSTGAQ